ncbi:MAG: hypothetical protein ACJ79Q_02500 [Gemmatimonadaceae bacterium]
MTVAFVSKQSSGIARVLHGVTRIAADVPRRARVTYDRALHPSRHASVRRKLAKNVPPKRILVLCYGNVCRSPYLQAALQRELPEVQVMSAGFIGAGRSVPPIALELGRKRGFELATHRSTLVTPAAIRDADVVVVMDAEQARRVAGSFPITLDKIVIAPDLAPKFAGVRAIRDPMNQPVNVFISAFDHLDRCAATLVGALRTAR